MNSTGKLVPDDDRARGILTEADREFLRGKKSFSSEQSERDARYRIRQRISNGIIDFSIIFRYLGKRDRDQIFDAFESNQGSLDEFMSQADSESFKNIVQDSLIINGVVDALAFIYRETVDRGISFEDLLETAVKQLENERGYVVKEVNVKIEIEREEPDPEELLERLKGGEPVTKDQIALIIRSTDFELNAEILDELFNEITQSAMESENHNIE